MDCVATCARPSPTSSRWAAPVAANATSAFRGARPTRMVQHGPARYLQVHAGQLERLGSDATADARTLLTTTRALSALVAAVADSVDRRLEQWKPGANCWSGANVTTNRPDSSRLLEWL